MSERCLHSMKSLLMSPRNAGNLELFWFYVRREFQRKNTQNLIKIEESYEYFLNGHFIFIYDTYLFLVRFFSYFY